MLVIKFDFANHEEQARVYAALEATGVDFVTLIKDGAPAQYDRWQVQAASEINAEAAAVAAALNL
jgi:hypothetical protein